MNEQDAADLELGRLVRQIAIPYQAVTIFNQGDEEVYCIVGNERKRCDGIRGKRPWDILNSAVAEAAHQLGIMPRCATIAERVKHQDFKSLRGS